MASGYLPVDTPPGTAPLPLGQPVPAKAEGGGAAVKRKVGGDKQPPVRRKVKSGKHTRTLTQRRRTS